MDIRNEIAAHDIERFHTKAMEFSSAARSLVLSMLVDGFEVKRKPDNSFVTSVDLRVEEHLRGLIHLHFPDHGIIGEEYPPANPQAAYQWIMDPIDGTEDFVQHLPTFGSILALHYRGEPVVGIIDHPVLRPRIYRSCFAHACAVTGQADATVDYGNPIWDFAASRILIEEAGGKFITVRAWDVPSFGRVYGSIMGKPVLVDRLAKFFSAQ